MPERVLTQLPQGVVLVDSNLLIDYANPAAERLLGVGAPGDPLPDPWPDFSLRELAARPRTAPDRRRAATVDGRAGWPAPGGDRWSPRPGPRRRGLGPLVGRNRSAGGSRPAASGARERGRELRQEHPNRRDRPRGS